MFSQLESIFLRFKRWMSKIPKKYGFTFVDNDKH